MIQLSEAIKKETTIEFINKELLFNAFVHRSYLNEHKDEKLVSNEKLEFLGDSVLSLATSIYLFKHFPDLDEGTYTDIKASVVRTESLAEAAIKLQFGNLIFLSKGEELNGGRVNKNILADSFESFIAALFLDQGFEKAYSFILSWLFTDKLDYVVQNKLYLSPKSRLQELIQATHKALPLYSITTEAGPEHKKEFIISVSYNKKVLGEGKGASKKEAEEQAAKNALEFLKKNSYNI
ncbi:MAG: ribonuclease III [Candidatus Roizmanbacteria bacterium]|nr:ribonuclease III [Candidatus Roizmanbacteria bacterium]